MKLAADFECTTSPNNVEVWLSGFANINNPKKIYQQSSIQNFFYELFEYAKSNGESELEVYFHNLKYDGSFILNYLLQNGFTPETFINDMGVWYNVKLVKNGLTIIFRDSMKIFPFSLATIATTYNLKSKGETPILTKKPKKLKQQWLDYHKHDIFILAFALNDMFNNQQFSKNTNASEALSQFKKTLPKNSFRRLFPILEEDLDSFFRKAYFGGWSYVNPRYKEIIIDHIIQIFDKNSMYSGVMLEYALPFGKPKKLSHIPEDGLWIASVDIAFSLKEKGFPCIHSNREMCLELNIAANSYVENSHGNYYTLHITNYDYDLIKRAYNIDIKFNEIYSFKSKKGFFDKYISKFRYKKENAMTSGERTFAKLMLNSLYGKFGSKILSRQKIPAIKDGKLSFTYSEYECVKPVYVPMAVFITSIARWEIINDAMDNYENFCYADTDSLHMIATNIEPNLKIHPSKFGYWKKEGTSVKSKYLRAKLYIEETYTDNPFNTKLEVKGAGMNPEVKKQVTFDNFRFGQEFTGKRLQKQVKGGVYIYTSTFKIKRNGGIFN